MPTLKLYGGGSGFCIPNYSIVGNLLYDVVAMTSNSELSPWEKLFVVKTIGRGTHPGYMAEVFLTCGCFAEARRHYSKPEHPRKLGDICWCEGDLERAEVYYSKSASEAQSYRNAPDDDRLIKLAFFREQWDRVVDRFTGGTFSRGFSDGKVCVGRSETAAQPFRDMLAVAVCHLDTPTPTRALKILNEAFGFSKNKWETFLTAPKHREQKSVAKLKARCRPKVGAAEAITIEAAVRKGDTPRARYVVGYIQNADASLEMAQRAVEEYVDSGDDCKLEKFIALVIGSGVTSISRSFLFSALGHDSFPGKDVSPERLVRLFSCHSIMNKRHFGKLLDLRFKHQLPLTTDDILTGVFQSLGRISPTSESMRGIAFDITRLASCREWARIRLDEWLHKRAATRVTEVAQTWRDGRAQPTPHPFYAGVARPPESPRNMKEWDDLMNEARSWLQARWKREIANSPWITENQLYQILRRVLKGVEVLQHARPTWLEPQHLDVYVPEVGIAVEYMGQQHFDPLDFFGGEPAFKLVIERDRKKAELCREYGIELIRVRFDENVGDRAREIANFVSQKLLDRKTR